MKKRTKNSKIQRDEHPEQMGAQPNLPVPTPEQIRTRAYEIYETRGGAPGYELDDWLLAEIELKAEIGVRGENVSE